MIVAGANRLQDPAYDQLIFLPIDPLPIKLVQPEEDLPKPVLQFRMRCLRVAATALFLLASGCLPPESTSSTNEEVDFRAALDLSSPQATFETMVAALASNDHAVRLACLTTEAKNREAGAAALNLMDLALKNPVGGDKFLTLLDGHGLTQTYINRTMATYGADPASMPMFTEQLGAKINDLSKFHHELSKVVPRPPLPNLEFISASQENERMIGKIRVGGKEASIVFRHVDGDWLIDSETK